jgi:hypothetical protein
VCREITGKDGYILYNIGEWRRNNEKGQGGR